jgi:CMP-N-acetylneuraminic acid synthetase
MNIHDLKQHKVDFTNAYIMPKERSIDIDTIEDFIEAERLMYARNKL